MQTLKDYQNGFNVHMVRVHVFALTFSKYLEKIFLFIKNERFESILYPNINFSLFQRG